MHKIIFATILLLLFFSCKTENNVQSEIDNKINLYKQVDQEFDKDNENYVTEYVNKEIERIEITERYGFYKNPFTGLIGYRDYIGFPYHTILKFQSILTGEVIRINKEKAETSVTIKSGNIDIEYFGFMNINEILVVKMMIKKGTYLGTLIGGGDIGMKLKIRMKYKGQIIDPSLWIN